MPGAGRRAASRLVARRSQGRRLRGGETVIVLAFALMIGLGAVSWHLASAGLKDIVEYRSPYSFPIEPGAPTARVTQRLVLVIVDGLGFAGVDEMPVLKDIGSRGAAFSLLVSGPSLSYPGWTTLLTGAPPEISGVITNGYGGAVRVDSLFDAARRAGIKTALIASEDYKLLFGTSVARGTYVNAAAATDVAASKKADDEVLRAALGEVDRADARFLVVHFSSVDVAAHASGAASAAYRAASAEVDARIGKILADLDLTGDTIVVTSSHGHTRRGGHGGRKEDVMRVPLVAAGAGIVTPENPAAEISWIPACHVDVAPTCAALLGTPVPAHSQGRVLFEAVDAAEHVVSERAIRQAEARRAFAERYLRVLGGRLPAIEPASSAALLHNDRKYTEATELALEIDGRIVQAISSARERFLGTGRLVSVPASVVVLGGLAWGLVLLAGGSIRKMKVPLIGAVIYFAGFYALVFARGTAFSTSMFDSGSEVAPFFTWRMAESALCGVIAVVVSGWLAWDTRKRPLDALVAGLTCVYLIVFALALQAVIFVAGDGVRFTRHLPDLHRAFEYYVDLLQTTVIGASSPVLAGLSVCAWWLRRRAEASPRGVRRRRHHSMSGGPRFG